MSTALTAALFGRGGSIQLHRLTLAAMLLLGSKRHASVLAPTVGLSGDPLQYILADDRPTSTQSKIWWMQLNAQRKADDNQGSMRQAKSGHSKVVSVIREKNGGGHTIEVEMTASDLERLLARVAAKSADAQVSLQVKPPKGCHMDRGAFSLTKCEGCKLYDTCKAERAK